VRLIDQKRGDLDKALLNQTPQKGFPFASPEYLADTCPSTGEPLIMLVSWGTHARNVALDSRASFTVRDISWEHGGNSSALLFRENETRKEFHKDRGTMDHARLTLVGRLIPVPTEKVRFLLDEIQIGNTWTLV
jgi:hypothetical protein